MIDAIILAAGSSRRMSINKLMFNLGKYSLINHCIKKFLANSFIDRVFVVTSDSNIKNNIVSDSEKPIYFVEGGESRTQSVANALKLATGKLVLIHDGARPFVSDKLINDIVNCAIKNNSAIPIIPVPDSLREVKSGHLINFLDREYFCLVQTPQGFNGEQLRQAYSLIGDKKYYDDSHVYSLFFNNPHTVKGDVNNKKITFDNDLFGINAKIGIGYDIHQLKEGLPLILGGVAIPYDKGFIAHSDGDVLIHSIIDALLGMASERDIGVQFPDSDNRYKNISSKILLEQVFFILKKKNVSINNICTVIVAEQPKLSDYVNSMISTLSSILQLDENQISINITTNENMGIIGSGKAIAVYTVCSGFG